MNFLEAIRISLESLRVNRLRSVLTLLGIVIGVMTVITVVAFISGLNLFVAEEVFNLGADVFVINRTPDIILNPDDLDQIRRRRNLLLADVDAVREACTRCRAVGAQLNSSAQVKYKREFAQTQIRGRTAEVAEINAEEIEAGRPIGPIDVAQGRAVAVIGADVADLLFPLVDPLGRRFTINNREFEVVGVGARLGSLMGSSRDTWVDIPITSFQKIWGSRQSVRILAKAESEAAIEPASDQARAILRARRHVSVADEDDFALFTNDMFLELWASISQTFFAVTIAISSISLVVGGIVVMNIMLVSVTERTREIGVRKALGARRSDVLAQFLIESATLALVGGVVGVLLAVGVATGLSSLTGFPAAIRWWSILLGLVVSTGVGLFFGIWPAKKAASLDPIEALRHE
jgi:putative ABC transport system permease protein